MLPSQHAPFHAPPPLCAPCMPPDCHMCRDSRHPLPLCAIGGRWAVHDGWTASPGPRPHLFVPPPRLRPIGYVDARPNPFPPFPHPRAHASRAQVQTTFFRAGYRQTQGYDNAVRCSALRFPRARCERPRPCKSRYPFSCYHFTHSSPSQLCAASTCRWQWRDVHSISAHRLNPI